MKKIVLLALMGTLLLSLTGCGELKKRKTFGVKHVLFANVTKTETGFTVKELHNKSGDVNLKTLQITSAAVATRLCGSSNNLECIDRLLDSVAHGMQRRSILKTYGFVMAKRDAHIAKLDKIYKKFEGSYQSDIAQMKVVKKSYDGGLQPKGVICLLNDESKFYKGSDIPFTELISIKANELKYPDETFHNQEIDSMFPHPVADFQANIKQFHEDLKYQYVKDLKVYNRNIRYRSAFYPIVIPNITPKVGDFRLKIQAPKEIRRASQSPARVVVHIMSKDFNAVYPYMFEAKNRDLKVVLNKKHTTFTSLNSKAITLQSMELLYKGHKSSILFGENFSFSFIAANASTSTPSKIFFSEHFKKAANFENMTRDKTRKTRYKFAITVNYMIEGKSAVQKLSVTKNELLHHSLTGW